MEHTKVSSGTRIKYKKEGDMMISTKLYSNGYNMVRIVIDLANMNFKLVDPVSKIAFREGGEGINNLEVLMRHAKKSLISYLGLRFEKESREPRNKPESSSV